MIKNLFKFSFYASAFRKEKYTTTYLFRVRRVIIRNHSKMATTFDDDLTKAFLSLKANDPLLEHTHEYPFLHYLGDVKGKTILDLGCGYGHYSRLVKKQGASRVVGVDIAQPMIDLANKEEEKNPLGIKYRLGDVKELEVNGQFDIVIVNAILIFMETIEELQKFVRVIYNNLKPEGRVVGFQPNGFSEEWYTNVGKYGRKCVKVKDIPNGRIAKIICDLESKPMEVLHHYLDLAVYQKVFKDVGFTSFEIKKPVLSKEALEKFPEGFWKEYLEYPYLIIIEAVK